MSHGPHTIPPSHRLLSSTRVVVTATAASAGCQPTFCKRRTASAPAIRGPLSRRPPRSVPWPRSAVAPLIPMAGASTHVQANPFSRGWRSPSLRWEAPARCDDRQPVASYVASPASGGGVASPTTLRRTSTARRPSPARRTCPTRRLTSLAAYELGRQPWRAPLVCRRGRGLPPRPRRARRHGQG